MGGLLSAYYLSGGDELFLKKAEELGNRLLPAFNTSTGLPVTKVTLRATADARARLGRSDGQTNLAEAATLSMEFTSLGRATGARFAFALAARCMQRVVCCAVSCWLVREATNLGGGGGVL